VWDCSWSTCVILYFARAKINNDNAQSDRISTMKMPKVIDFLDTRATEFFNQKIAYHPISTLVWTKEHRIGGGLSVDEKPSQFKSHRNSSSAAARWRTQQWRGKKVLRSIVVLIFFHPSTVVRDIWWRR
jgi:hypothetical protein